MAEQRHDGMSSENSALERTHKASSDSALPERAHYAVVWDEEQVMRFARACVPTCSRFVIAIDLFARRKYVPSLPKSSQLLQRVFIEGGSSDKSVLRKLLRLHVPIGSFVCETDVPVPQESLAVYASLTAKEPVKAMMTVASQCMETLLNGGEIERPHSLYCTEVGRTNAQPPKGHDKLMQVDLDSKDAEHLEQCRAVLHDAGVLPHLVLCTETRGGFHLVYRSHKDINKRMLHEFKTSTLVYSTNVDGKKVKDYWFSIKKDPLVIVPGTIQGGFRATDAWHVFAPARS